MTKTNYRHRARTPAGTLKTGAVPSIVAALLVVGAVAGLGERDFFSFLAPALSDGLSTVAPAAGDDLAALPVR